MNSIDHSRIDDMAMQMFDEMVTPLSATPIAQERKRLFFGGFDAAAESYFERPHLAGTSDTAYDFPGGYAIDDLVDALGSWWTDRGEADLATMKTRLLDIAVALKEQNEELGADVDIFCYTMF